ncbi:MAG TPA: ACT domain-containing protein [Desulfobacteria bacterium]|nr:ACT domain-containing protein [Desulfobacteria bacterium]
MRCEMVKQINVFSENRPGKLEQITRILADVEVNILAVTISSDEEYGVVRFIVDNPEKGFRAFKQAGVTVSSKEVLAVAIEDKFGSLNQMLRILKQDNVDVEDCYGFAAGSEKKAIIVLTVDDSTAAQKILEQHGYRLIGSSELYSL